MEKSREKGYDPIRLAEQTEKNVILSQLLEISKSINSSYNEYINNEIENSDDSETSETSDSHEEITFNSLDNLNEYFKDEWIHIKG